MILVRLVAVLIAWAMGLVAGRVLYEPRGPLTPAGRSWVFSLAVFLTVLMLVLVCLAGCAATPRPRNPPAVTLDALIADRRLPAGVRQQWWQQRAKLRGIEVEESEHGIRRG